jgi:hypothetical protein
MLIALKEFVTQATILKAVVGLVNYFNLWILDNNDLILDFKVFK